MFNIIEKTKIWFACSLIVILIGMGFLTFKGLNLGIDFAGGTVMQTDLKVSVNTADIKEILKNYISDAQVSTTDNTGIIIRSSSISSEDTDKIDSIVSQISTKYNIDVKSWSVESVGPSIGNELKQRAILSLIIAAIAMLLYVAFRFEIKFGVAAVIALIHDILITLSVYAILQIPVNSSFIAAVLTIVGYSINDTIVIFDRIRENLRFMKKVSITEIANVSITETMARSINTILTTLFTITAVYFIGVASVKELALPLIIGIISGCYSSIFIASPIWVIWKNSGNKKVVKA